MGTLGRLFERGDDEPALGGEHQAKDGRHQYSQVLFAHQPWNSNTNAHLLFIVAWFQFNLELTIQLAHIFYGGGGVSDN